METALLKTKSKKDLAMVLTIAKKIGIDVRQLSASEAEDFSLINAIRKGRTAQAVDTKKFLKKLRGE